MKSYNKLFNDKFKASQQIDEKFAELYNTKCLKSSIYYLKQIGAKELDIIISSIELVKWTKDTLSDQKNQFFK